ncbi:GGDEF domain-containing protein [Teredinibacter waterburyi]|uniref:GGDEF domain-containing protein n=1 Tax=Teredinibacter waterburyi TaxID=1500538 RepID=UPI00165F47DB|nr:GGDEF domain-containing protein [Teredinibacter waterburyi]
MVNAASTQSKSKKPTGPNENESATRFSLTDANASMSELGVHGFPGENTLRDFQFKLAHNLQCSLNLTTTLELFYDNIREAVTVSGLHYTSPSDSKSTQLGKRCKHRVSYTLTNDNTDLGVLEFSRGKPFLEAELAGLEMLTGVLYYPLRNALLYQQALNNSLRDSLTGIGNRQALEANFEREVKLAQRHQQPLSLLVIDIDHFKKINDNYGHRNGDRVLQHVATTIQKSLRETDQVFRFGGEEFVAILNNTSLTAANLTAERIRMKVAMTPIKLGDDTYSANISIGVSHLDQKDTTDSLFERADAALYLAKGTGRNRVICSSEMNKSLTELPSKTSAKQQKDEKQQKELAKGLREAQL